MAITLEQLHVFQALAEEGTYAKAAKALYKTAPAIVHTIRNIEAQSGLQLFDREQYRTQLTPTGRRFCELAERLVQAEKEFHGEIALLQSGWEPELHIIYDGVYYSPKFMTAIRALRDSAIPTHVYLHTAYQSHVAEEFFAHRYDFMVSMLNATSSQLISKKLPAIRAVLVAHKDYPLDAINGRDFIVVKEVDPGLALSTQSIAMDDAFHVDDFLAKKNAIMAGLGIGWMPEYLIANELKVKTLRRISASFATEHFFQPKLYYRQQSTGGKAAELFLKSLCDARAAEH